MEDRCTSCGDIIPEGRQVCPNCENAVSVTLTDIVRMVIVEMCDKYCKMPGQYTAEEWENVMVDICGKCPLNKLE